LNRAKHRRQFEPEGMKLKGKWMNAVSNKTNLRPIGQDWPVKVAKAVAPWFLSERGLSERGLSERDLSERVCPN
jgi:hypothetical protein